MPDRRSGREADLARMRAFLAPEIACWRGERPLKTIFWGYGVLGSTAFGLLYALSMFGGRIMLQQVLLPCMALYTFWLLVSLWRSSKTATNPFWGPVARQLAVAWALNTIMVLTFLQLELIETYLDVS